MPLNIKADRVNEINESSQERSFDPVPDGKYCATLFSAEDCTRETKTGNTLDYIKCHFRLEGGQYNNRREFEDIVYSNSGSAQHGEIGLQNLTRLFRVLGGTGDLTVDALSKLKGCLMLTIKTVPSKDPQYGPKRRYYFDVCDNCPTECCPGGDNSSPPSDPPADGGDIWS